VSDVVADPWAQLEGWIKQSLDGPVPGPDSYARPALAPLRRLRDALLSIGVDGAPGRMDLAVLMRHALWSTRTGHTPPSTWVPSAPHWPSAADWANAGLLVAQHGAGYQLVLQPWSPSWLSTSEHIEPGDAAARMERRCAPLNRPRADPFFKRALDRRFYSSPGQREAVRAVVLAAEGGTVVANLPTGSGKSAVAYAPAILKARTEPAVALMIIPTTTLALDQDRAFREAAHRAGLPCPDVLAYHGGLAQQAKEELRQRIRNGTQTIVFTSPESLLGGLRAAVFDAAKRGLLSLFAVDEAHVAVAWGEEFRPEFQFMAPLRDQLLEVQLSSPAARGFPTLLMSGTLTAAAMDRLARDFGRSGKLEVVSAVALRPEPEYWIAEDSDEATRVARVLDALAHLPRPAILYTTRPVHANEWVERLKACGYGRIAIVHGGTSETDRQAAMAGMRGRRAGEVTQRSTVDLVVGTSAYGLGVDQPDVRTIVHACLPESLDRFYQEVGRSGRDGHASVSVLIPAHRDWTTARTLAQDAIIGVEKAKQRWTTMRMGSEPAEGGGRRVKLGDLPPYLFRGSDMSDEWNLRTLLLLQQSGVLRIRVEEPPCRLPEETDEAWDNRLAEEWERQRTTRVVELAAGDWGDPGLWRQVEDARRTAVGRGEAGFEAVAAVLHGHDDLAPAFAREYSVEPGDVELLPDVEVRVARACGGCPACRREGRRVSSGHIPIPPPARVVDRVSREVAEHVVANSGLLLVLVEDSEKPRSARLVRRAIQGLIAQGLGSLVAPATVLDALDATLASRPVVVSESWDPVSLPDITTAIVAVPHSASGLGWREVLGPGPPRLLFVDRDTPDPEWPHQTLGARSHVVTLDHLLREV